MGGWGVAAGAMVFLVIGTLAANLAEKHYAVHDSSHIVVDELVGQLISLIPVSCTWPNLVVGFGWFRLFDTVKPWPAGWIDRNIPGGLGVMLDDVAAGVYAAGATAILVHTGLVDGAVSLLFC
jgi:phosphatidylglycerophosphatase A